MKTPLIAVALATTLLCDTGPRSVEVEVCRCAQRNLGEYFDDASEVVVGTMVRADPVSLESGEFLALEVRLSAPPYKSSREGALRAGEVVTYRTPVSSASCGVPAVENGTYVLFATPLSAPGDADPVWHVDTCAGSRVLLAPGMTEPGSFQDVPARFVPRQLNALGGLEVLASVAEHAPQPSSPANERLIGLLDVSGFSHAGFARLHAAPDADSPLLLETSSYDGLEMREVGYEMPSAVVYAEVDGWYKLRSIDGEFGWLSPDLAGTFFPYPELPIRRLAYIRAPWHGFVWPSAGAGLPHRAPDDATVREVPVEVHEMAMVGGFPWFRITVLEKSPCEGGDGSVAVAGWVPAYGPPGDPSVWFYSRGC